MKWLRLLLLVLLVAIAAVVLAGALLTGPLRGRAEEALRAFVERQVSAALEAPFTVAALQVSLAPLAVEATGIALGDDGAVGRVAQAHVALQAGTSLRQRRPVFAARLDGVALDLPALLQLLPDEDDEDPSLPRRPPPALRLRRLVVTDVALRLDDDAPPIDVQLARVTGSATVRGGLLRVGAAVRGAVVRRGEGVLEVARVDVRGGETAAGWRVLALSVEGDGLRLHGVPQDGALALDGAVDLRRLAALEPAVAEIDGTIDITGRLAGTLDHPELHATAQAPALAYGDLRVGAVRAVARLDGMHLGIEELAVDGLGGRATGDGTLRFSDALPYEARLTWTDLDLDALASGADLPVAALDGSAALRGALVPLRVDAEGSGRLRPAEGAAIDWQLRGAVADAAGHASLSITQGTANRANGEVAVDDRRALSGSLAVQVGDIDALRGLLPVASLPQVRGVLGATAQLGGTLDDPRLEGEASGRDVEVAGVTVRRLDGRFTADAHALHSPGIALAIGDGSLSWRGTLALDATTENAWSLDAARVDGNVIAALGRAAGVGLPLAGGVLVLEARASGPWPRVQLSGVAQLDDFWLGAERIERLRADVEAATGRWTLSASARKATGDRVDVRGQGTGTEDVTLTAECPGWSLTAWQQGERALMGGTLTGRMALRGPLAALSGEGSVRAEQLVLSGRPIGSVRVDVTATRGRWQAALALLDDTVRLQATLLPDAGQPFTVDGSWTDADFTRLVSEAPGLRIDSTGTLQARGRLADLSALEARAEIAALGIAGGPTEITADTPAAIVCRAGRCRLDQLVLRGGDTTLRISGEAGTDGRLQVVLDGAGTLRLLELIGKPIQSARGTFTVDARVRRTAGDLQIDGQLVLNEVGLDLGLPVAVTRTSGRIELVGDALRIASLTGRVGTGTFSVGGQIDLNDGPELTWQLVDVGMDPLPSLEMEVDGEGTVTGSWQQPRVAGDVRISQLLYDRDIELTDFLPSFNRALADAPRREGGTAVALALHITAPGELYVENNLARLQARADLRVDGTTAHPVLAGRIEALDGEIMFRGRTFELLGGTVDFRPSLGLVAALNIGAESLIETPEATYGVGVRVTGTTADPRVTLTSDDPSLTQTDIAALITLGRTTAQLRAGGGGGFSVYDALGIVPRQVSNALTGQAERILPIDRIEFEPTFSPTSGAFQPQLTIGKDLTDNLSASVGQTFGVLSRTRAEVEYRLGPRVSVPVSWESETKQEAGALGAGIKLRYEFWRITRYTLLSGLW